MPSVTEALQLAWQHHQAGRLAQAEQIYRQILAQVPERADVLHLLGLALYQSGKHGEAVTHLARAVELDATKIDHHNHLAAAQAALGNLDAAESGFRRAISMDAGNAQLHFNLAALLALRKKLDDAAREYEEALRLKSAFPEALLNLGNVLREQGRDTEAIARYKQALEVNPKYAKASMALGSLAQQQGRMDEAAEHYRRVITANPQHAEAYHRLGLVEDRRGNQAEAVKLFHEAVRLRPDYADAYNNLGCAYQELREWKDAASAFRFALKYKPDFPEALNNLGSALQAEEQLDQAIPAYRQALALKPDFPEAESNLASALQAAKQFDEALEHYQRALEQRPNFAEAHTNLGSLHQARGDCEQAIAEHHKALEINPQYPDAHYNLGSALQALGRSDEALAAYEQAIRLDSNHAEAHCNRSFVWLGRGDFLSGWDDYEWRLRCKKYPRRTFTQSRWDGARALDKTLLVHAEQGLGDTIQFIRYLPLVAERAGKVILEVQRALVPLLRQSGFKNLVAAGEPLPEFDLHVPLLSLPGIFGTTASTIPVKAPYLKADPQLVERWREKLADLKGFRIGIAWQGNRQFTFDRQRSIPLAEFAPVAAEPGVQLVSLQKGDGTEQIDETKQLFEVIDLGPDFDATAGAFVDSAAVMQIVDLVITSDTATAHLAGALGVPVWVAVSSAPEWRWVLGGDRNPWYPSMRVFRQPALGDWASVFQQMAENVRSGTACHPSPSGRG